MSNTKVLGFAGINVGIGCGVYAVMYPGLGIGWLGLIAFLLGLALLQAKP